jgi:hypothetical protein
VAHADWGTAPRKRQVAVARRAAGGERAAGQLAGYVITSLARAPDGGASNRGTSNRGTSNRGASNRGGLLDGLAAAASPGLAVAGFDFAIGLPLAYARAAGISSFPAFLDVLGSPPWQEFGLVAAQASEISLGRPFYPARPGGTRRDHLYQGLGLTARELRRQCEGRDAETLFWTLGGKQVGKAALAGWQLLAAARRRQPPLALWPFAGPLPKLLDGGAGVVAAETYPREYYRYVRPGPASRWSKRRRADRLAWIPGILRWAESLGVGWDAGVRSRVEDGLSAGPDGEDEFDAVIGLLGMIAVITGTLPSGEPDDDPAVTTVEGWILGRPAVRVSPGCAIKASCPWQIGVLGLQIPDDQAVLRCEFHDRRQRQVASR